MRWHLILSSIVVLVCSCSQKTTKSVISTSTVVEDSTFSSNSFRLSVETDCVFVSPAFLDVLGRDGRGLSFGVYDGRLSDTVCVHRMYDSGGRSFSSGRNSGLGPDQSVGNRLVPIPVLVRKKYSRIDSAAVVASSTSADYKSTDVSEVKESSRIYRWYWGVIFGFVVILCLFVDFVWRSHR